MAHLLMVSYPTAALLFPVKVIRVLVEFILLVDGAAKAVEAREKSTINTNIKDILKEYIITK